MTEAAGDHQALRLGSNRHLQPSALQWADRQRGRMGRHVDVLIVLLFSRKVISQ